MRLWKVFLKSLREMIRDPLMLSLTLAFAPVFMLVYALFFPGGSTTYTILALNLDAGAPQTDGAIFFAGNDALKAIAAVSYSDGKPMLLVRLVESSLDAETQLRNRTGVVFLILPEDFSHSLLTAQADPQQIAPQVVVRGDLTNPYYPVAAILATSAVDGYVQAFTGRQPPVQIIEQPLAGSATRTEYETYVPGLLVFAIILMVFLAAMTIAREIEGGTLRRLQMTRITAFDLLGGITLALVLVGIASEGLAFAAALTMGFRSQGSLVLAVLIGGLTSLAVIGMGLLTACFSRTVAQAFVIANFPLGFLMLFSGVMYPLPKTVILTIGKQAIGLFDILPTTHAVSALNKIFNLGVGAGEILFELGALTVLAVLYFTCGVWLFRRKHLKIR